MDDKAERDGWAFETKTSEFLVDLRGGNVWRDGELINCAGLTIDRHFKVLRRLLEKSPATVPYGELLDGIGRETQAVYDVVNALRSRLGPGVIRNDQRRGYALEGTAHPVPLPYPRKVTPLSDATGDPVVLATQAATSSGVSGADLALSDAGHNEADAAPRASSSASPATLLGSERPMPSRELEPAESSAERSTATDSGDRDKALGRAPEGGTAHELGRSGLDHEPGGQIPLLFAVSGVFGAMVGLALLVEVAYQWPKYSTWALPTSVGSGFCAAIVALLVLTRMRQQAYAGRPMSLALAAAVLFSASAVLSFIVAARLPDEPLVRASVQTMPANVGWIKSVGEALFLPMLALVPLQTIFVLAYEVRMGRTDEIRNLLQHRRRAIAPAGAHYVPPLLAFAIFLLVAGPWILANGNLFTSLEDGQYYGLFFALDFARVASGLLTLLWVFLWYVSSVRHLKRVTALRR
jgi:hypothetical protein